MQADENKNIKHRKLYLSKLMFKAASYKLVGNEEKMATALAEGFLKLGGVYVKFLQGVLLQLPMMKLWKNDHRFDVYENVPIDRVNVHDFLKNHLSVVQRSQIVNIEDQPFASGSFGQVYKAVLAGGEQVAIKILRPNTRKILKSDLRLIKVISKFIASLLTNWDIDINMLVKDFVKSTLAETDYRKEIKFAQSLYDYYLNNPTIVIPKTYELLSNRSVIVQEYIDGLSLAQLLRRKDVSSENYSRIVFWEIGSDLSVQLRQLGVELNKAILNSAPIHGDPHPGNIRLLPDNKVALLDFGLQTKPIKHPNAYYAVLEEFWRSEYLNEPRPGKMFVAYIRFYAGKLYQSIKLVSNYRSSQKEGAILLDEWIAQFSEKIFRDKVSPEMLMDGLDKIRSGGDASDISVDKIVNPGNRFSISVKIDNGLVIRALANYLSLIMELGYRSIIPYVYNDIVLYVESELPQLKLEEPSTVKMSEAIETVYLWLEKVAIKDKDLYDQIVKQISPVGL